MESDLVMTESELKKKRKQNLPENVVKVRLNSVKFRTV
jgi:hypothetical protein